MATVEGLRILDMTQYEAAPLAPRHWLGWVQMW